MARLTAADTFAGKAIASMQEKGFATTPDLRSQNEDAVVIGFYRDDEFQDSVANGDGRYSVIYVTTSARELRSNSDAERLEQLVAARVGSAVRTWNANTEAKYHV